MVLHCRYVPAGRDRYGSIPEISGNRLSKRASNIQADQHTSPNSTGGDGGGFSEADIIRRCRQGDTEAFAELVLEYQHRVYNLIYRMCGRAADAEELTQETFLRAFERMEQFRGDSRFYTWLFRIAANMAMSHRRRRKRVTFLSLGGRDEDSPDRPITAEELGRRENAPDAAAIQSETRQHILEALATLDETFRVVVVLRDIEDLDYSEIAEVLDLPVGTIKSRLHRARCMLKDRLQGLVDES